MKTYSKFIFLFIFLHSFNSFAKLAPKFIPESVTELKLRRYPLTSKKIFKKLKNIYKIIDSKQYKKAEKSLLLLLSKTRNKFSKAQLYQVTANLYIQTKRKKKAIQEMEKALSLEVLPLPMHLFFSYNIIQVLVSQAKYALAKKKLEQWFSMSEFPSAQAYILYANLLFLKKDKKSALENINYALKITSNPRESWINMAIALNYENKKYIKVEALLRKLIEIEPNKKSYWKQLSQVQLILEKQKKSLASLELAYKQNLLIKEKDILDLIYLYMQAGIAMKAANLAQRYILSGRLKKNKKNYHLLAKAFVQAEELNKAIDPLQKASSFSKNGKIDIELGQVYVNKKQYKLAIKFFNKAIKKKGLGDKIYLAYLMMGISFFKISNKKESLKYFTLSLASSSDNITDNAQDWIRYISKN